MKGLLEGERKEERLLREERETEHRGDRQWLVGMKEKVGAILLMFSVIMNEAAFFGLAVMKQGNFLCLQLAAIAICYYKAKHT